MKVTFAAAQYPISQHQSFDDWEIHTEKWVQDAVRQHAQVLLFPEYASMELVSTFSKEIQADIHQQVLELQKIKDNFCNTFKKLAQKYQVIIVAPSFPVLEKRKVFNRAFVFSPKGLVGFQDKFFMTRFEKEEWGIACANPKVLCLFEAEWGSFGIQICYDVEFAIGSKLLCAAGASLILAPSCTETIRGATRVHIGARARALENQAYTIVSQTVGNATWSPAVDINYGFSGFYATPDKGMPEEGIISTKTPQEEGWHLETLDFALIEEVRKDGQVFNHRDQLRWQAFFYQETIQILRRIV